MGCGRAASSQKFISCVLSLIRHVAVALRENYKGLWLFWLCGRLITPMRHFIAAVLSETVYMGGRWLWPASSRSKGSPSGRGPPVSGLIMSTWRFSVADKRPSVSMVSKFLVTRQTNTASWQKSSFMNIWRTHWLRAIPYLTILINQLNHVIQYHVKCHSNGFPRSQLT